MDASTTTSHGLSELAVFTTLHLGVFYENLLRTYDGSTALELATGLRWLVNGLLGLPADTGGALVGARALSERTFRDALHCSLDSWTRFRADTNTRPSPTLMLASLDRAMGV
jgi:hypothetical protein